MVQIGLVPHQVWEHNSVQVVVPAVLVAVVGQASAEVVPDALVVVLV